MDVSWFLQHITWTIMLVMNLVLMIIEGLFKLAAKEASNNYNRRIFAVMCFESRPLISRPQLHMWGISLDKTRDAVRG